MNTETAIFIASFILPVVWYRVLFFILPTYFKRPFTRSILKVRWHHLHYGIACIFAATLSLLLIGKTRYVMILFGLGLGLVIDLFVPSLLLETDREKELAAYKKSLVPTIILSASIAAIIFALSRFLPLP